MHDALSVQLNRISVEEFAAYQRDIGERVSQVNGVYWRQVRPFFFRPLLPYREYRPESTRFPFSSYLGGVQFAVPDGAVANSLLNIRVFNELKTYSLASLDRRFRKQVQSAKTHFEIRSISDLREFKRQAFPVFQSYAERTRYGWARARYEQANFSSWADSVYRVPGMMILGGYRGLELGGVSLSLHVEDTLIYDALFCDTESLRLNLSGLMLHALRETAAANSEIAQIYVGMNSGERGLDDFYRLRGCHMVRKSAFLHLNPLTSVLLKWAMPKRHVKIWGSSEES